MSDEIQIRTLTVEAIEEDGNKVRVTLAPANIHMLIARDGVRAGEALKQVQLCFADGGMADIWVSEVDLLTLESCIGLYVMPY